MYQDIQGRSFQIGFAKKDLYFELR